MKNYISLLVFGLLIATASITCLAQYSAPTFQEVKLVNYLGNKENIHPKVLYFEKGWKGYKFWMAYTPYPLGVSSHENPCIAISNDGVHWESPANDLNPLALAPEDGYNSDTHLVYRPDLDRLECWYRGFYSPDNSDYMMMSYSDDGKRWSKPMEVAGWEGIIRLSPAVFCMDGRYIMYYAQTSGVYIITSGYNYDYSHWSEPFKINLGHTDIIPWHLDVVPGKDGWYEIVLQACGNKGNNFSSLYYFKYNRLQDVATEIQKIVSPDGIQNSPLGQGIYRSSLVNVGKEQYLYISAIDLSQHRHMLYAKGENLISRLAENVSNVELIQDMNDNIVIEGHKIFSLGNSHISVYDISGYSVGFGSEVEVPSAGIYFIISDSNRKKIIIK